MLDRSSILLYIWYMNKLPLHKRTQIINLLVEGNSLRSTSRIAGVSINTVTKLLVGVGRACEKFHNEKVVNVNSRRVQCDEIWSFVYAKEKNKPDNMENVGMFGLGRLLMQILSLLFHGLLDRGMKIQPMNL